MLSQTVLSRKKLGSYNSWSVNWVYMTIFINIVTAFFSNVGFTADPEEDQLTPMLTYMCQSLVVESAR